MEFFNNKKNNLLKFKINSEGLNTKKIETRLILTTENNKNYIFFGNIKDSVCSFNIPELSLYEKNDNGKINFEIVSGDIYFKVWDDKFNINTKATITLENIEEEVNKVSTPSFTTSAPMVEMIQESVEDVEEEPKEEPKKEPKKEPKELKTKNETKTEKEDIKISEIKNFNEYLTKKNNKK